jgi:hypothetical protein
MLLKCVWIYVNLCEHMWIYLNLYGLCGCRPAVRQCAAVQQCAAVRAAVCGSVHGNVRAVSLVVIVIIIVDASAYILSRGWLRIFSPDPLPLPQSAQCDRTHCSHLTWGAHMTTRTAKSYWWIRGNLLNLSRKRNLSLPPRGYWGHTWTWVPGRLRQDLIM